VSATFTETSCFRDLSPFVSATFMICVYDFPCGEISVKVSIVEFGLSRWCNGLLTLGTKDSSVKMVVAEENKA